MVVMFTDRVDAAKKLCRELKKYKNNQDTIVVGLTRGGVVIAKVIADFLKLNLRALVVKKIGAPGNPELAIGAIASKNNVYWNEDIIKDLKITNWEREYLVWQKEKEIEKLAKTLKLKINLREYKNKNVIVVDDGVATGATVIAAAKFLQKNKTKKTILATPIISNDTLINIKSYFDRVTFLKSVENFYAVGQFYEYFEQVSDEEMIKLLATSH